MFHKVKVVENIPSISRSDPDKVLGVAWFRIQKPGIQRWLRPEKSDMCNSPQQSLCPKPQKSLGIRADDQSLYHTTNSCRVDERDASSAKENTL